MLIARVVLLLSMLAGLSTAERKPHSVCPRRPINNLFCLVQ